MPREDITGAIPEIEMIYELVQQHEGWIDKSCLNLYPASNIMSERARAMLASTMATRVAEGDIGKKYQSGTKYLEQIEVLATDLVKQLYHANFAECRILSGTMANAVVFAALTEPGDTIMALSIPAGGHISHNKLGVAGLLRLIIQPLPFDPEAMNIDVVAFRRRVVEIRPRIVILGGSLMLFPPPIQDIRDALDGLDTIIMFDISHVSGLVAGQRFPNPLAEGSGILTSSTYKTLPGPPGGFIACNDQAIFRKIRRATFPGMTASSRCNNMAALAITCIEMLKFGTEYAAQIVENSKSLARELDAQGFEVLGKRQGYSETHQIALDVSDLGGGHRCAKLLESGNIIVNKNLLFHDSPRMASQPSGLRVGTQEVTRLGMQEKEMRQIAAFISSVLLHETDQARVATKVRAFRSRYQTIHYC